MASRSENRRIYIWINDKEVKNDIKSIGGAYRKLNSELAKTPRHTSEYNRKLKELRRTKAILDDHRRKVNQVNKSWSLLKQVAAGVFAGNLVTGAMQRITSAIPNLIDRNARLSDSMADVQKTTGLTDKQMDELMKKFKRFNTRTARKELLGIAAEAGKLGVRGVENIASFVEQANELQVALGDDLGEGAVLKVSKMADVFNVSMQQMGSGINAVADSSKANAGFLTDFLARLGGTAEVVDVSAGEILGYGAALDELGLRVEMSSTALNGFFIDFVKNTEMYGQAAGFAEGELSKLIGSQGTNSGFLAFLERLKEMNPESDQFLRKLEEIGIDGDRGSQVFLALSQNVDLLRQRQQLANKEIEKGTSLTNEYNRRNTNFAANIEKINRAVSAWFTNSGIIAGLEKMTGWAVKFTETKLSEELEEEIKQLGAMTVALNVANTSEEERRGIIEKLQEMYPEFLSSIDAEKSSNEDLNAALEKVNQSLINKMVLQKEAEKIEEEMQNIADLTAEKIDYELKLRDQVAELMRNNDQLAMDSSKTLQQNAAAMLRQLKQEEDQRRVTLRIMRSDINLRSEMVESLTKLELLETSIGQRQDNANALTQRRQEIMRMLGMTIDENTEKQEESNEVTEEAVQQAVEQRLKLADLKKQLEANREAREDLAMLELSPEERMRLDRLKAEGKELQFQINKLEELISIEDKRLTDEQRRQIELRRRMKEDVEDGISPMPMLQLSTSEYKQAWRDHLDEQSDMLLEDYINGLINEQEFFDGLEKIRDVYMQLDQEAWDNYQKDKVNNGGSVATGGGDLTGVESPSGLDKFKKWWGEHGHEVQAMYSNIAGAYSGFLDVMDAMDQRRLMNMQKAYNTQADFFQKQLDAKVISQESYNYQMEKLERKKEREELKIRRRAFIRDKIYNIATATMNAIMAASSALATNPYPISIALAASAGAMGAAQVAAIAAQPAPQFAKGGILNGPSHSAGGMPIINPITGRKEAEVEGGELIMTKGVGRDPVLATMASAINQAAGGRSLVPDHYRNASLFKFDKGGVAPGEESKNFFQGFGRRVVDTFTAEKQDFEREFGGGRGNFKILEKLEEVRQAVSKPGRSYVSLDDIDRGYEERGRADGLS
jgi:TP901 family phage tail tape measure protein